LVLVAGWMTVSNAPCGLFSPRAAILMVPGWLLCVSPTNGHLAQSKTGPAALTGRKACRRRLVFDHFAGQADGRRWSEAADRRRSGDRM